MKLKISYFIILFLFSSCSPKVVVKNPNQYPKREAYQGFIFFTETDTVDLSKEEVLGDIQIKDGGLTINCDFEIVLNLAKAKALDLGANALQIYEHRTPDVWSSCHRIKAKALRLKDIKPYENEVIWDKRRPLTLIDFKGTTVDRPFQAATLSIFRYKTWGRPIDGYATLTVETYFDCGRSYFKIDDDSIEILKHEQLHFDISELYARKFVKRIKEEIKSTKELPTIGEKIVKEIVDQLQLRQDKYDSEVYADRKKQTLWVEKIRAELKELEAFEDKKLTIKYKL
jgi:ribosomal protein L19E